MHTYIHIHIYIYTYIIYIHTRVVNAEAVQRAMAATPDGGARAQEMLAEMAASMSLPTVRFVGWLLTKVNRRLFSAIMVDEESVEGRNSEKLPR